MSLTVLPEPVSLGAVADTIGAHLEHRHRKITVSSVATPDAADSSSLCYIESGKLLSELTGSAAAAVIVKPEFAEDCPGIPLVVDNPRLAWAIAGEALFSRPESNLPAARFDSQAGQNSNCVIAASATLGENTVVGNFAVVGQHAVIGDNTRIASGVAIGEGVQIGSNCYIGANTTIYRDTTIGSDCIIHGGAVIGADGFGFEKDPNQKWHKYPQLAGVQIGDNVEIGAGSTVDGGALSPTVLGNGVKIDNQVQIGHGTRIGEHSLICAAAAIAGSARIGKRCIIAGMAGISDNVTLADDTTVLAMSMVASSSTEPGQTLSGMLPARTGHYWSKWIAELNRMIRTTKAASKEKL